MKPYVQKLIRKFLEHRLSKKESEALKAWMEDPKNRAKLKREIQLNHLLDTHFKRYDAQKAFERFKASEVQEKPARVIWMKHLWKYAAILVLSLGMGYYFLYQTPEDEERLVIPNESVVLDLGDGTKKTLSSEGHQSIVDVTGTTVGTKQGDTLRYDGIAKGPIVQHTLTVPYGKTHKLILPDGTFVHLNAGTTLRYPTKFTENSREVQVVGEAYFEVEHDTERPFIVNAHEVAIQVYGTRFNVSAYAEDNEISTTLLEGSVGVVDESGIGQKLKPGQMGTWDKLTKTLQIGPTDVNDQVAWVKGELVFHSKPFKDILVVLERKYNVRIENRYPELNAGRYRGTFDTETIEEVLGTFTESRLFDYHIENNTVIIDKPSSP